MTKAKDLIRQRNYAGAAGSIVGVLGKAPKNPELMKVLDEALEAAENDANAEKRTADTANASGRPEYANATARFQSAANARKAGRPEDAESVVRDYAAAAGLYRDAAAKAREATPPPAAPAGWRMRLPGRQSCNCSLSTKRRTRAWIPRACAASNHPLRTFRKALRSADLTISNQSIALSQDRQSATVSLTVQNRYSYSQISAYRKRPIRLPSTSLWRVQRTPGGWIIVE